MIQEDYIKRGIEKFKALDDKAQTDLIEYLTPLFLSLIINS